MKMFRTTLSLAALAVLMTLGPASETSAQVFDSEAPPATATVSYTGQCSTSFGVRKCEPVDATLTMTSPPAVPGLNNNITLKFVGGGPDTAKNRASCGSRNHADIAGRVGRGAGGEGLSHRVTLNGSSVSMPVEICGDWAAGTIFRIGWFGHQSIDVRRGRFLTSFPAASNCVTTHRNAIGGVNYAGSIHCWTDVTID